MKREITLATGSEATRKNLLKQLEADMPDFIRIHALSIENPVEQKIESDYLLVSGESIGQRLRKAGLVADHCKVIVARRTINYDYIDSIVTIPAGTKVLLVNDTAPAALEAIESLQMLGLDHLDYIPYYPQKEGLTERIEIAVSVGEGDKVPGFCSKIYEIGTRIISLQTMVELMNHLDISTDVIGKYTDNYLNKIINVAKRFALLNNQVKELNYHLNSVIDSINDGLVVYDYYTGKISVLNEDLKVMMGLKDTVFVGKNIASVIKNPSAVSFFKEQVMDEEKILNIMGKEVLARKFMTDERNVICIFKKAETARHESDKLKQNLIRKGLYGKYTFADILGASPALLLVKEQLKKLSKTDLTILMEGESGTGKELFASAVHNASGRRDKPFLAVNFSSIHDSLLESELFGYDEGSFTGALKGGKEGIFELADGGTIFLDEIGDISEKMQARLLRVLQEKEVMRIGGKEIRQIDVRIIAATNKNLKKMVRDGTFRRDLYHRLKIGYVKIPPVRERKSDLGTLISHFLLLEGNAGVTITAEALERLKGYNWYGNVREIRNTVIYMLALREGESLTVKDIPDSSFFEEEWENSGFLNVPEGSGGNRVGEAHMAALLKAIGSYNDRRVIIGRRLLMEALRETYEWEVTEYQVRKLLAHLEAEQLIYMSKGKVGILLTEEGRKYAASVEL